MAERLTVYQELKSKYFDKRQEGSVIDTLIIHSMFNPECPNDKYSASSCQKILDKYQVSAHYIIDRKGTVWQMVAEKDRAWHAGASQLPHSDGSCLGVNHFSIGIELVALEDTERNFFTEKQYLALVHLISDIKTRYSIKRIYGHKHIARGRKTDPWGFDWKRFKCNVKRELCEAEKIEFPDK